MTWTWKPLTYFWVINLLLFSATLTLYCLKSQNSADALHEQNQYTTAVLRDADNIPQTYHLISFLKQSLTDENSLSLTLEIPVYISDIELEKYENRLRIYLVTENGGVNESGMSDEK